MGLVPPLVRNLVSVPTTSPYCLQGTAAGTERGRRDQVDFRDQVESGFYSVFSGVSQHEQRFMLLWGLVICGEFIVRFDHIIVLNRGNSEFCMCNITLRNYNFFAFHMAVKVCCVFLGNFKCK